MAVTKQYISLTLNSNGNYLCSVSKTKTPYAAYVIDNGGVDINTWKFDFKNVDDITAIRSILSDFLKNNPKNTQPTPLFFFPGYNGLFINIANWASSIINSSDPAGIGCICYLAPIAISQVKPTNINNLIGQTTINGAAAYIYKIGTPSDNIAQNGVLQYLMTSRPTLTYKPHKDLSLDTPKARINIGISGETYSFNTTTEGVVKTIESTYSQTRSLVFANTPDLQYNDVVTQYTFVSSGDFRTNVWQRLAGILFQSLYYGDNYPSAPYTNFFSPNPISGVQIKALTMSSNFQLGTEFRALISTPFHKETNADCHVIGMGASTRRPVRVSDYHVSRRIYSGGSQNFFSTFMFFNSEPNFPQYEGFYAFVSKNSLFTVAYPYLQQSSSETPLIAGKITNNMWSGPIVQLVNDRSVIVGSAYLNLNSLSSAGFYLLVYGISEGTVTLKVVFNDYTYLTKNIAVPNGSSRFGGNLFQYRITNFRSVNKSKIVAQDLDINAILSTMDESHYPEGSDLIDNPDLHRIIEVYIYAERTSSGTNPGSGPTVVLIAAR